VTEPLYLRETRTSYDTVAEDYADLMRASLDAIPWERAMLAAFAELVRSAGAGPVADVGCGPGHVTAHLQSLGVPAFGVDLSSGMVEVARRDHPGLRFEVGSMTALDLADGELGGILAWWSVQHTPLEILPRLFTEFGRVLAPGGHLLLGFHVGDERRRKKTGYGGHPMSLDLYLRSPDRIVELAIAAGFEEQARLVSQPGEGQTVPQACVLVRKPTST
jgi:SAM-dependent methyltransferase